MEEAYLCPPTAIGWKNKAKALQNYVTLASRAFVADRQAASALHIMAVLQVYQAKLPHDMDESGVDLAKFKELRGATGLALRATKATACTLLKPLVELWPA